MEIGKPVHKCVIATWPTDLLVQQNQMAHRLPKRIVNYLVVVNFVPREFIQVEETLKQTPLAGEILISLGQLSVVSYQCTYPNGKKLENLTISLGEDQRNSQVMSNWRQFLRLRSYK